MRRSDLRALLPVAIGALALAGCASSHRDAQAPTPTSVEPSVAYAAPDTRIVIRGSGFQVKAVVDVGGTTSVDAGYRAWLGGLELADVRWIDVETLSARIPAGLARGRHDLAVAGPFGRGVLANAIEILDPPAVDAHPAAPAEVVVLQEFDVALDVENATSWMVAGAVADVVASGPVERTASSGGAQDVPAGGSARWQWRFRGTSPGDVSLAFSLQGTDPRIGAAVTAAASASVAVKRPASLEIASLAASPNPANLAQEVVVEMVVSNSGGAAALDVAASLTPDPDGAASWLAGPAPASAAIGAGEAATFVWRWAGTARGTLRFTGTATGVDALSATSVSSPARDSAGIAVQRPAALVGDVVAPARVNLGQLFDVGLAVSNLGDATAKEIMADLSISPAALVAPEPPPVRFDLAGSSSRTVWRRFQALGVGDGTVQASATGWDATDGRTLTLTRTAPLAFDLPAQLAIATQLLPPGPLPTGRFELRVTVTNAGEAVALGVTPGTPTLLTGSTAAFSLVSGPTPVSGGDLLRNDAATFSWTFDALSVGTLGIGLSATAVDANDRATRSASVETWTQVVDEARDIGVDALGYATSFAFVTAYGGDLVAGPSGRGTRLVRMDPAGATSTALTLSFPRDTTGNSSDNKALGTPPYPSIGYTGCHSGTLECGPDNEDGRGLLASFTLRGQEWLLLGGARSAGDFSYVYVTRDVGTALSFWYVDLSQLLGPATRGISAARAIGDRLYLGFPDNGGSRPYGTVVLQLPTGGPGLDAVKGVHALDLQLDQAFKAVPSATFRNIAMVDSIGDFGGRVYFLNDVGCIVSRVALPTAPADFANCSPTSGATYDRAQSVAATRQYDIEPWEKAWPQVAVWNGRLYAIRNLVHPTLGNAPQLWSCDPAGGDPVTCEPGDWRLVAADATNLTRFGNPNASAASMLVATARHLYVGFDDKVGGVRVYRTSVAVPQTAADFQGNGGCSAADPTCAGFGGNGLGLGAATARIFDAKALELGGATFVYVTAGGDTNRPGAPPPRLVRLPE